MQILPSTAAFEGPVVNKRKKPSGIKECADAADGYYTRTASRNRTSASGCKYFLRALMSFLVKVL